MIATLIPVLFAITLLTAGSRYFARQLRQPGVIKVMDRVTGCLFIGFAAKLALSRR